MAQAEDQGISKGYEDTTSSWTYLIVPAIHLWGPPLPCSYQMQGKACNRARRPGKDTCTHRNYPYGGDLQVTRCLTSGVDWPTKVKACEGCGIKGFIPTSVLPSGISPFIWVLSLQSPFCCIAAVGSLSRNPEACCLPRMSKPKQLEAHELKK